VVFNASEVNAFALPGGKVGVYTCLLQLAESDAELATALGHEIGHVIARHGAERMSKAIILAGVGELAASTVESKTDQNKRQLFELAYGGLITVGRVLPHSRAKESEADQMGAVYVQRGPATTRARLSLFGRKWWREMGPRKKRARRLEA